MDPYRAISVRRTKSGVTVRKSSCRSKRKRKKTRRRSSGYITSLFD